MNEPNDDSMRTDRRKAVVEQLLSTGWIRSVEWFSEIDSTNCAARRALCELPLELPALFLADRQTAGRGRNHRHWWSPDGCLMLTLAIDRCSLPEDPSMWSQLALVCGIAVAKTAELFVDSHQVQLKWPNDVMIQGKKVAGMLIESVARPVSQANESRLDWLIGIGLNVDMAWREAPTELLSKATCLSTNAGRAIERASALIELANQLQLQLNQWRSGGLHWLEDWRQRCLLGGRAVHIRISPNQQVIGLCQGIDATGRLIVREENSVQVIVAGEVLAWR